MSDEESDDDVRRSLNDLEMMRRRHMWPRTGVLCLKNPRKKLRDGWPSFATLIYDKGEYFFLLREGDGFEKKDAARHGNDELLTALVREGWIVD